MRDAVVGGGRRTNHEGNGRGVEGGTSAFSNGAPTERDGRVSVAPQRNLMLALVSPCFGEPTLTDLSEIDLG